MFEFIKNLFKTKQETPQVLAVEPVYVSLNEYPELKTRIQNELQTFTNRLYFSDVSLSHQLMRELYDALFKDVVETVDPERTLDYTNWVESSKIVLTSKEFFDDVFSVMAIQTVCDSNTDISFICDAINLQMLLKSDVEKLESISFLDILFNTFGALNTNKQVNQFFTQTVKKNTVLYLAYSNSAFDRFSAK